MILRNQAKCLRCDDHIASFHRHDFRSCKCGAMAVDGGISYLRRLYDEKGEYPIEDTSIDVKECYSNDEGREILGALCVLSMSVPTLPIEVYEAQVEQELDKPWFQAPASTSETARVLDLLVSEGLAEVDLKFRKGRRYYVRVVELAPWRDD